MDSKKCFYSTVNHRHCGRIPVDYTACPQADDAIKKYYQINTEREVLDVLGSDFYYLSCRDISQNESVAPFYRGSEISTDGQTRKCPFGIIWQRGAYKSKFAVDSAIEGPLVKANSEKDILAHKWPNVSDFDFSQFDTEFEENSNRVIIGGFWSGILGDSYRMNGFENFLLNIALKPQMIKTLINKMTDFYLELNDRLFSQVAGKIDVWFFGNDFGSQKALLLSPDMIADFFMPSYEKLCSHAKSYNLKIMNHSCGAIREIIPFLIDAGVDIIDPVQVTALGMEPVGLKQSFGSKITFHGGIDTQYLLPYSAKEKVFNESLAMIETMSANGGYIFAPSQILGPDIPAENISAMYQAARHYNNLNRSC